MYPADLQHQHTWILRDFTRVLRKTKNKKQTDVIFETSEGELNRTGTKRGLEVCRTDVPPISDKVEPFDRLFLKQKLFRLPILLGATEVKAP